MDALPETKSAAARWPTRSTAFLCHKGPITGGMPQVRLKCSYARKTGNDWMSSEVTVKAGNDQICKMWKDSSARQTISIRQGVYTYHCYINGWAKPYLDFDPAG